MQNSTKTQNTLLSKSKIITKMKMKKTKTKTEIVKAIGMMMPSQIMMIVMMNFSRVLRKMNILIRVPSKPYSISLSATLS